MLLGPNMSKMLSIIAKMITFYSFLAPVTDDEPWYPNIIQV